MGKSTRAAASLLSPAATGESPPTHASSKEMPEGQGNRQTLSSAAVQEPRECDDPVQLCQLE